MKIGILGSGDVGKSLGKGLAALSHSVMIGSSTPTSAALTEWQTSVGKHASTGSMNDAAKFGEVIILAVNWEGAEETSRHIRPEAAGKIIIDVTNPIDMRGTKGPSLLLGHDISGGEMIQQILSESSVVKTLNFVSHATMVQPHFYEGSPSMFYCGNNPAAKAAVEELLRALGWKDTTDLGDIDKCRILEPLALLWVTYGMVHDGWGHAVAMLKQ
jgi:8-hydroxy-5-deazaflavin:NADPH oxidoreductase